MHELSKSYLFQVAIDEFRLFTVKCVSLKVTLELGKTIALNGFTSLHQPM